MQPFGILAIWQDCRAGHESELEGWFQGEHFMEGLTVPGFLYGRRHRAISGASGFFNFYLTQTPDVLASKPYLERVDQRSPMTTRIMSGVFLNMNRTVCRRALRRGPFRGAYAVTVRFDKTPDEAALVGVIDKLIGDPAIAGGEVWIAADQVGLPVSKEEQLRGGDRKIKGALMVDTLYTEVAEKLGARFIKEFSGSEVGVFRVLCEIGCGDL